MRRASSSASRSVRVASTRAASTNCSSFHVTRACSGVFVRWRRSVHDSRVGASKVNSEGGGTARFQ